MFRNIRLLFLLAVIGFIHACATGNTGLSSAEDKVPVSKINKKLRKYIDQLYSGDANERAWAVYNIGKAGKQARNTVPYLVAMLGDNEIAVMQRYVGRDYTTAKTTTVADEAVKSLARIGQPSVKPLLAALKDSNKDVVIRAIRALGILRNTESIKPLAKFISHQDKRIRLEAANSLSRFKTPWVSDYLLAALKNKDTAIRSTALYAIGKRRNPAAISALLPLLNDPQEILRAQVVYILSQYRSERVIKPLLAQLSSKDTQYRLDVITALGNIKDYRVIEALIDSLADSNAEIRNAAADSLSQISGVTFGINQSRWKNWWENKVQRARRQ